MCVPCLVVSPDRTDSAEGLSVVLNFSVLHRNFILEVFGHKHCQEDAEYLPSATNLRLRITVVDPQ